MHHRNARIPESAAHSRLRSLEPFRRSLEQAVRLELGRPRGYGCVTFRTNGAHTDMTAQTFLDSHDAISDALSTLDWASISDFRSLRQAGLALERAMFAATGGINTHKGLIFLLLFPAYAWIHGVRWQVAPRVIAELAKPLHEDYRRQRFNAGKWQDQGIADIRQIPLSGYRRFFALADHLQTASISDDDLTLELLATVDDTTTLSRSDLSTLRQLQRRAELARHGDPGERVSLDRFYRENRISSGGVADLFSVTCLLKLLRKDWL